MDAFNFNTKLDQTRLLGVRANIIEQLLVRVKRRPIPRSTFIPIGSVSAPEYARQLGLNGKEQVRNNFLITRHIKDYLLLFESLFHDGDVVSL